MSDVDILQYIADSDDPVVGTTEVADEFAYSTNYGASKRLKQMEEDGYLASKKLGQVPAWWITDAGLERLGDQN